MSDSIPTFYIPKKNSDDNNNNNHRVGRRPGTHSQSTTAMKEGQKEAVISTNDDAASCKLSCVNLGYYKDDYVQYFVKTPIKRPPLINRGFFSRVECIESFTSQFIEIYKSYPSLQIVNIGCGFDTFYFRLKSRGIKNITFFEVDYKEVVENKIKIISSNMELKQLITDGGNWDTSVEIDRINNRLIGKDYRLSPIDLTNSSNFTNIFNDLRIDYKLPTMFISECVIIYIPTKSGNELIEWVSNNFKESSFITYEQIKPYDEFGSMMMKNIDSKGCPLLSINSFPEITDQKNRYLNLNFNRVDVLDMNDVYNYFIDKNRIKEIERLEIFDEFEEWFLIQGHYCFVLAIKSDSQELISKWKFQDKKTTSNTHTTPNQFYLNKYI